MPWLRAAFVCLDVHPAASAHSSHVLRNHKVYVQHLKILLYQLEQPKIVFVFVFHCM